MLYKADIREYASQRMLRYFIPITIIATPLGQITGDRVSTDIVEAVGGVLVTFVAVFEIYQKRDFFASLLCRHFNKDKEKNPDAHCIIETDGSGHGSEGEDSICVDQFADLVATVSENAMAAVETNRPQHENSIRIDESASLFDLDATLSENTKAAVEKSIPQHEGEASIRIDDFASLFDLDAKVGENAKVVVEKNIPQHDIDDSIRIDDFASSFDLSGKVSQNLL
jgi:hypothetical protein